jgi:hypothetical protein
MKSRSQPTAESDSEMAALVRSDGYRPSFSGYSMLSIW